MATHHAVSGEVVALKTSASELEVEKRNVLTKTKGLEPAPNGVEKSVVMLTIDL